MAVIVKTFRSERKGRKMRGPSLGRRSKTRSEWSIRDSGCWVEYEATNRIEYFAPLWVSSC